MRLLEAGLADYDALIGAVREHDVVVAQLLPPRLLGRIWREPTRLAVDLYNPTVVEAIEATRAKPAGVARAAEPDRRAAPPPPTSRPRTSRCARASASATSGSACSPAARRSSPTRSTGSRSCRSACAREPPRPAARPVMRGPLVPERRARAAVGRRHLGLARRPDRDPRRRAPARRRRARLPGRQAPGAARARRARRGRARRSRSPASSASRARAWCSTTTGCPTRSAARGCSRPTSASRAHPAHLETRFAYRTRIADYLWAGLPVVTSAGDVLGDHVAARRLGRAVAPGDDEAFAVACADAARRARSPSAPTSARRRRSCGGIASSQPLLDFCRAGTKRAHTRHRARQIRSATIGQYAPIAMETLSTDGAARLGRKLAANARRALKRHVSLHRGRGDRPRPDRRPASLGATESAPGRG